jgi:GAF domain-containing protein
LEAVTNSHLKNMELPQITKPKYGIFSETQRYAIFGASFGFLFPLVGTILRIFTSQLPLTFFNMFYVQRTDSLLWVVDTAPIVLGLFAAYTGRKQDILSKINDELRNREYELETYRQNLEQRVNERTSELVIANRHNERRSAQFESIASIARTIISSQTLDVLLPQITETISEQFGFYHVGIFLLDTNREYAILAAANSAGGKLMLARNHRLLVGGPGIVGYVTKSGQTRLAVDTGRDSVFFNTPELPDSHSKIALPLRSATEIIGALDVHSKEMNAFAQEDATILSTLADQVSIAIQNARSHQLSSEALAQADAASMLMSDQQWKRFFAGQPINGYVFDGLDAKTIQPSDKQNSHSLAIPLTLRGTRIGTFKLSAADPNRIWTEDEITIIRATAERTALAVEGARLLQEAQKRAAKERTIGEISAKIGGLINIENILQTAIQELGNTMPNTDIAIQFTAEADEQKL